MVIENAMYFVLGLLTAGLVALMIMPAVWRRAVRLTRKRIEAATPMTMAEFRADKDQLRAEFALTARRLELTIENLRQRLGEQVGEINSKKHDVAALRSERDQHDAVVREFEAREAELRERVLELERQGVELAQRLRGQQRALEARTAELESARQILRGQFPEQVELDPEQLTGSYEADMETLMAALAVERQRSSLLESQIIQPAAASRSEERHAAHAAAVAELREALIPQEQDNVADAADRAAAEAQIASAESKLHALLEEQDNGGAASEREQLLAERFSIEEQVETVRTQVLDLESTVLNGWKTGQVDHERMRERLNDIATEISRLVYAGDAGGPQNPGESLFDRVQRFSGDKVDEPVPPKPRRRAPSKRRSTVSDRMSALRPLHGG